MYTPHIGTIPYPVAALYLGNFTMRATLYVPGLLAYEQSRMVLPAPDRVLGEKIATNTSMRRNVYLHGTCMGNGFVAALRGHLRAGLDMVVHPRMADSLCRDGTFLESLGISIAENCPPLTTSLKAADFDADFWHTLNAMAGLPEPRLTLVAAIDDGRPLEGDGEEKHDGRRRRSEAVRARFRLLRERLQKAGAAGVPVPSLLLRAVEPFSPRLHAIQRLTHAPVTDHISSFVLGMLSRPAIAERSRRTGILLVRMNADMVGAALVFQERLLGMLELPFSGEEDTVPLLKHLEAFRLGWMPPELARGLGGHVCLAPQLPEEAEGFKPAFIAGSRGHLLAGHGQIIASHADNLMNDCWGILWGYRRKFFDNISDED